MIEIKIPKEVTKYETKLVGPFTARQCISLVVFVPIIIVVYNVGKQYLGSEIAPYLCFPFGGLAAGFGWIKPYGLKFEDFLRSVFLRAFLAPTKRVQKSDNLYSLLSKKAKDLTPEEELIIDAQLEGIPEDEVEKALKQLKKQKKAKKPKYKKSKKAIF